MTAAELQVRLAQPFDRGRWLDTLGKALPRTEIFAAPQPVPADTTRAESIVQLGRVHLAGQRNLALLEVTVGDRVDLLRNRVGLRQLVARYIDQAEYHGVLAIFHQRDAKDYPCIVVARNSEPGRLQELKAIKINTETELVHFAELIKEQPTKLPQQQFGTSVWQLENRAVLDLLNKIRAAGKPLADLVDGRIYAGIKTGLNEAFVINSATRSALISEDRESAEVIRQFLKGKDVNKWVCETGDRYIIYTPHGFEIEDYPAIKRHLNAFRNALEKRALDQKWFELQQPQLAFTKEFAKTKIVYPNVALGCRFALDTGSYLDMTSFCVCSSDPVLLAVLNSSAMSFYFEHLGIQRRGGYQEFKTQYVRQFPVPDVRPAERSAIESLVKKCLAARGGDLKAWETEINDRVYRLYGLDKDQIKMVEESAK